MMRWVFMGSALSLTLTAGACSEFETGYFRDRVNEATIEQVVKRYGPPHKAEPLEGKRIQWTYFDRGSGTSSYAGMARSNYCRAYALIFDQQEVLREWQQQECHN